MLGQMPQYGKKVFCCLAAQHEGVYVSFLFLRKFRKIMLSNEGRL